MKLSSSLYYPAFALTMLFFVLVFIPRKEIKRLFWFSLLWGSAVDLFLILLFKTLNFYHYVKAGPFDFYGSPIFINLSWSPAVLLFLHFLPESKGKFILPLYLSIFAVFGVFIGVFLTKAGLIIETHWNELLRFPVVCAWFYACYKNYLYLKRKSAI